MNKRVIRMKNILKAVMLSLVLMFSSVAFAQQDPAQLTPVTLFDNVSSGGTSSPYAVYYSSPNQLLWFQLYTASGTGSYKIEGSLDTEAHVLGGTAKWSEIIPTTTTFGFAWVANPPPYIRVTLVVSTGTFTVFLRGFGNVTFRKVV